MIVVNSIGGQLNGNLQLFSIDGKLINVKRFSGSGSTELCPPNNGILLYRFINLKGEYQQGKIYVP